MITTALVFDHRGRVKDDQEEASIEVRITIDRKVRYISTGIRVSRRNWQHGIVVDRYDCYELNERLGLIKRKVDEQINNSIKEGVELNLSSIRKELLSLNNNNDPESFLSWIDEQIPLMQVCSKKKEHYRGFMKRLREFGLIKEWKDLTVENIYKWDAYLRSIELPLSKSRKQLGMQPKKLEASTIYNHHKFLKKCCNLAYKYNMIKSCDANPYSRLRNEFERGDKENIEYLTEDEMEAIMRLYTLPGSEMDVAKNLFIVQMYTGLSYIDTQNLNLNAYKLIEGKWIYNGQRTKTGVPYVSQLLPPVVDVLTRFGWNVPKMQLQHYNEALKLVGAAAGIKIRMHSHLARHTFATWMLRKGVKIENLARMLGHTNIKQTQRYAKVIALSVHDDFDMVAETFNKEKAEDHH